MDKIKMLLTPSVCFGCPDLQAVQLTTLPFDHRKTPFVTMEFNPIQKLLHIKHHDCFKFINLL